MFLRWFRINNAYSLCFILILAFTSCGVRKKAVLKPSSTSRNDLVLKADLSKSYSEILGVSQKNLNIELYAAIDRWMGVPHRLGGMNRLGVDCSGFVFLIYREVYGKDLPRVSRDMASIIKRKHEKQLKEGDLLFFSFGRNKIDHVGIYLQNGKFVHVSTKSGVIISNLKDPWYYKYFTSCGSPKL